MTFKSKIPDNEPIIDSNNDSLLEPPDGMTTGYEPRDFEKYPLGFSSPKAEIPILSRDEWTDRIEEMERTESRITDVIKATGIKIKDQNGTNYCWIFGVTFAVEVMRAMQGLPYVPLSPTSVGCLIKNFRNQGGWGIEGMEYIIKHGIVPEEHWPCNDFSRKLNKQESWNIAKEYKVIEWMDVEGGNMDLIMTILIDLKLPVPVGFNWWGHLVCAVDPVVLGKKEFGYRIANSWNTGWGEKGYGILTERKASKFSEAIAPRVILPSA